MTTAKQAPAETKGKPVTTTGLVEIKEALIPVARLEALIAMGRAFPPVVTLLSSCLLVTTGASVWLVYRDQHRAPVYFATDSAGRAVEMKPLTEPTMSRDQVTQYVVNALTDVMSMDYANYKDTQFKASVSFSQDAFAAPRAWFVKGSLRAASRSCGSCRCRWPGRSTRLSVTRPSITWCRLW